MVSAHAFHTQCPVGGCPVGKGRVTIKTRDNKGDEHDVCALDCPHFRVLLSTYTKSGWQAQAHFMNLRGDCKSCGTGLVSSAGTRFNAKRTDNPCRQGTLSCPSCNAGVGFAAVARPSTNLMHFARFGIALAAAGATLATGGTAAAAVFRGVAAALTGQASVTVPLGTPREAVPTGGGGAGGGAGVGAGVGAPAEAGAPPCISDGVDNAPTVPTSSIVNDVVQALAAPDYGQWSDFMSAKNPDRCVWLTQLICSEHGWRTDEFDGVGEGAGWVAGASKLGACAFSFAIANHLRSCEQCRHDPTLRAAGHLKSNL